MTDHKAVVDHLSAVSLKPSHAAESKEIGDGSVDSLLRTLAASDKSQYGKHLQNFRYVESEWKKYAFESNEHYTRNLIASKDFQYDLLLLVWKAGQKSAIHDHKESGCWMRILAGELTEKRYKEVSDKHLVETARSVAPAGSTLYMDNSQGVHAVESTGNVTALSLHLYAPPILDCRVWAGGAAATPSIFKANFHSVFGMRMPEHFFKPTPSAALGGKHWPLLEESTRPAKRQKCAKSVEDRGTASAASDE
jgi:cysteine dioxygenase